MMHTRELHTIQLDIYKIGRSHILDNRMKQYPKGSKIICMINCENSVLCEKELIKLFKANFIQRLDYGTEYFEGDKRKMIKEIFNFINSKNDDSMNKVEKKDTKQNVKKDAKKDAKQDANQVVNQNVNKDKLNNNIKKRTCPKCNIEFKFTSMLKTHFKRSYHCLLDEEEINTFFKTDFDIHKCNKCSKPYDNITSLKRHLKNTICGKSQSNINPIIESETNNLVSI